MIEIINHKQLSNSVSFEIHYSYKDEVLCTPVKCHSKKKAYIQLCCLLLSIVGVKLDEIHIELSTVKHHYLDNSQKKYFNSKAWNIAFWKFMTIHNEFHRRITPSKKIEVIDIPSFLGAIPNESFSNHKKCSGLIEDLKKSIKLFKEAQRKYQSLFTVKTNS